jgi:acetolactate synthase-1/2/3 large subunit
MECLNAEGVDVVFGLPGGANLPTYDAGVSNILVLSRRAASTRPMGMRRPPARSACRWEPAAPARPTR